MATLVLLAIGYLLGGFTGAAWLVIAAWVIDLSLAGIIVMCAKYEERQSNK